MKKQLAITLMAALLAIGMSTTVIAEESESSQVEIEVDSTVQLDVKPDQLDYTDVGSGADNALEPGEMVEVSDEGFEHIDVLNVGSDRLDLIDASADIPDSQPFGTEEEDGAVHNTGNLVTMSLATVDEEEDFRDDLVAGLNVEESNRYLNRVEFFEDNPPEFIQTPETGEDQELDGETLNPDDIEVGRFRVGELDYYFVMVNEDGTSGTYSGGLLIAQTPTTPEELGTFDFSEDGDDYSLEEFGSTASDIAQIDSSQDFVHAVDDTSDANGEQLRDGSNAVDPLPDGEWEVREYAVYVDETEDVTIRTTFNTNAESPSGSTFGEDTSLSGQSFILDAGGQVDEALQPGENFPLNVGVHVPNGIDADSIEEGTVTLSAEGFEE